MAIIVVAVVTGLTQKARGSAGSRVSKKVAKAVAMKAPEAKLVNSGINIREQLVVEGGSGMRTVSPRMNRAPTLASFSSKVHSFSTLFSYLGDLLNYLGDRVYIVSTIDYEMTTPIDLLLYHWRHEFNRKIYGGLLMFFFGQCATILFEKYMYQLSLSLWKIICLRFVFSSVLGLYNKYAGLLVLLYQNIVVSPFVEDYERQTYVQAILRGVFDPVALFMITLNNYFGKTIMQSTMLPSIVYFLDSTIEALLDQYLLNFSGWSPTKHQKYGMTLLSKAIYLIILVPLLNALEKVFKEYSHPASLYFEVFDAFFERLPPVASPKRDIVNSEVDTINIMHEPHEDPLLSMVASESPDGDIDSPSEDILDSKSDRRLQDRADLHNTSLSPSKVVIEPPIKTGKLMVADNLSKDTSTYGLSLFSQIGMLFEALKSLASDEALFDGLYENFFNLFISSAIISFLRIYILKFFMKVAWPWFKTFMITNVLPPWMTNNVTVLYAVLFTLTIAFLGALYIILDRPSFFAPDATETQQRSQKISAETSHFQSD